MSEKRKKASKLRENLCSASPSSIWLKLYCFNPRFFA